jgi:hypothetical protein
VLAAPSLCDTDNLAQIYHGVPLISTSKGGALYVISRQFASISPHIKRWGLRSVLTSARFTKSSKGL